MKQRDRQIVRVLERFKVLTRDHIIQMFFRNHKQAINSCNTVLRRLVLQGHIRVHKNVYGQYLYYALEGIKIGSTKTNHWLAIADFILSVGNAEYYEVEPDYGKGFCSPDCYLIYKNVPFYIEIQRTTFSKEQLQEKVKRYEKYFESGLWKEYTEKFPVVLVITDSHLLMYSEKIRILQANSWNTFLFKQQQGQKEKRAKIRINNSSIINPLSV